MIVGVASSSLRASTPAASSAQPSVHSMTDAVTQRLVGHDVHLTDQPMLGPPTLQLRHDRPDPRSDPGAAPATAQTHGAPSQHDQGNDALADAQSAGVVSGQVTDRSSVSVPVPTSAATETHLAVAHRCTESSRPQTAHSGWAHRGGGGAARAADAAPRPASPPFFFEADASEESLVDFGGNANEPDAAHPSVSVHTAGQVSEARPAAVAPAAAELHDPKPVHQALLHQQGAQRPAAPAAAQADSLTSTSQPSSHMQRPLPLTVTAAEPLPLLQRTSASAQLRMAGQASQHAHQDRLESNAHARLQQGEAVGTDADDSKEDSKACSGGAGDSKENEPVGMARAVRGPREGQPRGGRQAAAKPPKPVTSSKVSATVSKHTVWCFAIKALWLWTTL